MFIAPLLITAAAGYWVLERAEHQKGRTREIGRVVAVIILALSAAGITCRLYGLAKYWCPSGKMKFSCPMLPGGQRMSPEEAPAEK